MRLTTHLNLPALVTCHTLYVVLCDLAECCVFVKQSVDPFLCGPSCDGHPFFQSYGVRLPSSFKRFHSRALVYSTHPPVSVCGTGTLVYIGDFLGCNVKRSTSAFRLWRPLAGQGRSVPRLSLSHRAPTKMSVVQEYLTCCPSPTPYGLDLGPD